jgi:predicted ATPase
MPKARTDTAVGLSREPGYYSAVVLCEERISAKAGLLYPFNIPAVRSLGNLKLDPRVTIVVGENGSGKSTLIEAVAVAAGMNAEGGSKNFRFSTRPSESKLHTAIELVRGPRKEKDGYFLRAECMYNVATDLEKLDSYEAPGPKLINSYGEVSLHDQSHGESFFAIIANRLADDSFIVMDEPESALSPSRQLYLLAQIHRLVEQRRCQIVLSTHSPILMSYPGALLYRLSSAGIENVKLSETEHFTLTRDFLGNYKVYLNRMFKEMDKQSNCTKPSMSRKGGDRATASKS